MKRSLLAAFLLLAVVPHISAQGARPALVGNISDEQVCTGCGCYFRDDAKTTFGVVRFQRGRDNPHQYDKLKHKIMNDPEFTGQFVAPEAKKVWKRSRK